jgi:succinoglycan biosynthesis transport protein ExoP
MHPTSPPAVPAFHAIHLLAAHPVRWLLPAVAVALLAWVYTMVHTPVWEASQTLIIRNEATNSRESPGKFSQPDQMKTVQETILELVKSRGVLESALADAGPPAGTQAAPDWPAPQDVAALREGIKLSPPKGAEFGRTEVFYLKVRDADPDRGVVLARAICDQLERHFQELRDAKAQSMIGELVKAADLARADLAESTTRLTETETLAGSDLAELRILQDSNSGESVLRRSMTEIENELRQARAARQSNEDLLNLLRTAQDDPGRLVATPNRLLESQPALRRLKEGLLDSQLRTAELLGRMSAGHPRVVAAKEAESEVARHLHDELAVAVRGIEVDLHLNTTRLETLEKRLAEASGRMSRLAGVRASYANLVAENRTRNELLQRAEQNLAEARAIRSSATTTSLLTRIGVPDAGIAPVGPGRLTIVLAGIAGGLLVGFGVLLLTVQPLVPAAVPPGSAGSAPEKRKPAHPADGLSLKQALQKLTDGHNAWN